MVKAIASSVERLLRYANCSGSSEAGNTEQMCSLTSFSKHLLKMGVRATGLQSWPSTPLVGVDTDCFCRNYVFYTLPDKTRDRI